LRPQRGPEFLRIYPIAISCARPVSTSWGRRPGRSVRCSPYDSLLQQTSAPSVCFVTNNFPVHLSFTLRSLFTRFAPVPVPCRSAVCET
jgi:hypothetical protein